MTTTPYATRAQLYIFGAAAATFTQNAAGQDLALLAASAQADGYLSGRYTLPLTEWGEDLIKCVCAITAYDCLIASRVNPEGYIAIILSRYNAAIAWLEGVRDGLINPPSLVDSTPTVEEGGPSSISNTRRRWIR